MPNICFSYMYRDASNCKNHGEAVFTPELRGFTNRSSLPLDEIERRIKAALQDGEYFIAWQIKLDELFFETPSGDDHPWHEFKGVEVTTTHPAFDPANWVIHRHRRDITEFLADLEQASEAGWDATDVRADLAALFASQREQIGEIFADLTSTQLETRR